MALHRPWWDCWSLCMPFASSSRGRCSAACRTTWDAVRLLLVSQVGTFIGFLILAYANALWLIFLSRAIDGITAGNLSLAQAYISDVTKPEDRAKSFALIGIAFGMGFLIGPGLSGFLSKFGYQYPILVAAGLSATSIVATYFLLAGSYSSRGRQRHSAQVHVIGLGKLCSLLSRTRPGAAAVAILRIHVCLLHVHDRVSHCSPKDVTPGTVNAFGPQQVGYVYAFLGLLGVILQGGMIGRLVKTFGETNLARAGFFLGLVGLVALGFTHSVPLLLVTVAVASSGTGIIRPTVTSMITQKAGRSEQGVILGLTQSLNSISAIAAPALAGFLIDHSLLSTWAAVGGVVCGIALLF